MWLLMPHLWCSGGRGEAEGARKLLTTQMGLSKHGRLSAATTVQRPG